MSEGPQFYDDEIVYQTYMERRQRPDAPNDLLEKPALWDLILPVEGCQILDLGCGDAAIASQLFSHGARSYLGIDGSQNMISAARQNVVGSPAQVVLSTIESWEYPPCAFNLVISRLALHYIQDLDFVFRAVYDTLEETGRFVFSVEHPVITSSDKGWQQGGARQDWIVDNYFDSGARTTSWMGGQVIKYHRTVEGYFTSLKKAGFTVEQLQEACPRRELFADEGSYNRRKRIPLFLILAARKAR